MRAGALLAGLLLADSFGVIQGDGPVHVQCQTGVCDCASPFCASADNEFPKEEGKCASYTEEFTNLQGNKAYLIVGFVIAAIMAWQIGANDASNSWGTSVGSGALTMKQAVWLGGAAEFLGASLLGSGVASTLSKGLASPIEPEGWACGYCDSKMSMYQLGMIAALTSAAIILFLATCAKMPLSTTHAIISGVVGMTLAGGGEIVMGGVMDKGLMGIVFWLLVSPIVSGLLGGIIYKITRMTTIDSSQPARYALRWLPMLYATTTWLVAYMIFTKSKSIEHLLTKTQFMMLSFIPAVIMFVVCLVFLKPYVSNQMKTTGKANDPLVDSPPPADGAVGVEGMTAEQQDAVFVFRYLLVFTAFFLSFSHGANDTANASAALGVILKGFSNGRTTCGDPVSGVPVLIYCGAFVGAGVIVQGAGVIKTIGEDLTKMDFQLAFSANFAAMLTVLLLSFMGYPVSTTQCQIGAVFFIGMLHSGSGGVSGKTFGKILAAWICTPILAVPLGYLLAKLLNPMLEG